MFHFVFSCVDVPLLPWVELYRILKSPSPAMAGRYRHVYYKHRSELDSSRALAVDVERRNSSSHEAGVNAHELQVQDEPNHDSVSEVFNRVAEEVKREAQLLQLERLCLTTESSNNAELKSLGYTKPKEIDLYNLAGKEAPENIKQRPVMHYVPINETLKAYLSHEDVVSCIRRESFESEHLTSFTCGSLFENHPLFSVEKNALRIHLYTDELELCNPLGGNTKKYKICCIYFQVGNIGPKNLSSLESIHLVAVVRWAHVLKFGYETIMKPLIADLKTLGEGITIQ
ncbi:Large tegument protein deneddylase [Frankliniella fusca]|uniref:Large tegument protein deneddylase n=1 Tax=Frankliniella fusca TaxID=407009 RepID=A0AAE1LFM2_9NEOP|nr:Large tegument protein deneddylase [Frankliniella fusca]